MAVLWVVGDSTLSAFDDKYYYPRYGYGTMLSEYLDDLIEVRNLALSGRSSKSFLTEPEYDELISGMRQGDFLLVGFGHNDEKMEAARHTSGRGRYDEAGTFANSLYTNYYMRAKQAGCTTILCTPIVRRPVQGRWTGDCLHIVKDQDEFIGGDYSQAIRDMAAELGIPFVDMTTVTKKLNDDLTYENTKYLHAWPSDKELSVDNTHTNIWGGRVNAWLCLEQIAHMDISGLSEHVVTDAGKFDIVSDGKIMSAAEAENAAPTVSGRRIPSREYLVPDSSYVPVVFDADLKDSIRWKSYDGWKGTVFGDIPPEDSFAKFTLEPVESGVHIAVRDNAGKISAVTDGIAMYYKKVPVGTDFELSAKVHINSYFKNDQVSFGLMVRDDCYTDMQTPAGLGDYVAAAPFMLTRDTNLVRCFARKSGKLFYGDTLNEAYKPGDIIDAKIKSTGDGYALYLGDGDAVTGGFDFKLTAVDPDNVYVGMFVSRNADITFTDIKLTADI